MHKITNLKKIRVFVGSKNPVKVNAAKVAICQLFPDSDIECNGMHTPSGVPDQPMTDRETRDGAVNRVKYCQNFAYTNENRSEDEDTTELFIAMEGGVDNFEYGPATFAYTVIATKHQLSIGRSAQLPISNAMYESLLAGEELGDVMDRLFNTKNIKQQGGAIGLLTQGHATRESIYTQALILAMAPMLNPQLY
ncbi:inosine/xanthosine triphosphatase [Shewanella eurypsychrophilus]|uniref:Inosine/xanthosine triphosphatase n=1 Tax=Shewanella eurypsychrophilus TaxID=2593656 RepID=A0ABX6V2B9_9GAMM|nr:MULTISPECIES: inosine/xanthosine triphosphatase [Shewanella]QFU21449.1 non-canonical purine NTP phosphatase [Shewanella sp. YLB-09]QPG56739.1 inosine/xanthosine triphosphatase [Shewanella eurypsychrophilus]